MWTGRGRTSPGAPIPLRHPSSRPAGECAGSENRRLSAASTPGAPVSHQPRRLDAWLARRSTTPTSRAGRSSASPPVAAAALPVPRRRRAEPGRGTAGPGPRGLPADRRRARSAAAKRTGRARGPGPRTLSWRSRRGWHGAPVSHQPRRLDAWLARRSTTPTSRAGEGPSSASPPVAAAALPVPRRRRAEPGRGTAGAGPRGLPADRRRARSAAAKRTGRARGPGPRTLSWRSRRGWRCGCGARAAARAAGVEPVTVHSVVSGWASDARRQLVDEPAGGPPGRPRPRQSDSTSDADALQANRPHVTRSRSSVRRVGLPARGFLRVAGVPEMHLLHDTGEHEGGRLEVVEPARRADGVRDGRLELARRREDRLAVPEAFDRRVRVDVGRVGWASALRADLPTGVLEPAAPGMFAPVLHLPAAGGPLEVSPLPSRPRSGCGVSVSLGGQPKPASMTSWTYWPVLTRPPRSVSSRGRRRLGRPRRRAPRRGRRRDPASWAPMRESGSGSPRLMDQRTRVV